MQLSSKYETRRLICSFLLSRSGFCLIEEQLTDQVRQRPAGPRAGSCGSSRHETRSPGTTSSHLSPWLRVCYNTFSQRILSSVCKFWDVFHWTVIVVWFWIIAFNTARLPQNCVGHTWVLRRSPPDLNPLRFHAYCLRVCYNAFPWGS